MGNFYSIELKQQFSSQTEMLKAVYAQKDNIISLKKKNTYHACIKGQGIDFLDFNNLSNTTETVKSFTDTLQKGYIYPIISNTNVADSHLDVHLNGSMKKTVKEQQGKIYYIINHDLVVGNVIAYPKDMEMLLANAEWSDLGKPFNGSTELLLFKLPETLYNYSNKDARFAIEGKHPVKNSIRMRYIDIEFGVKERNREWARANEIWDRYANNVVNISEVEEIGYLWFVKELAIQDEGSLVLKPSNEHTEILYAENNSLDSQNNAPFKQDMQSNDPNKELKERLKTYSFIN